MFDLSAAFDTVDRKILLQRVTNEFGIVGTAQQWISSYLEDRSFRVTVDGTYSKDILLQHELPQGSVIGPLGFVFYTHTVGHIIRHHQHMYHIYADDIQIYLLVDPAVPGDVVCGMFKISRCVEDINSWMIRNKLKLNPDKTEFFYYVIILPQNCFAWCQLPYCWWYYSSIIYCAQLRCCFWSANEYGPAHHQTLPNHQLANPQPVRTGSAGTLIRKHVPILLEPCCCLAWTTAMFCLITLHKGT